MATTKTVEGKTPNGGVKSVAYFRDDDGNPVDESIATRVEVVEIDEQGEEVFRTYALVDHPRD